MNLSLTLIFPLVTVGFLLLVFSEYLPLLRLEEPAPAEDSRLWRRRDSLLCLLLTAAYAVTAFVGLGDTRGITSLRKFSKDKDYALIELAEPVKIGEVRYYASLHTGMYSLQFSEDGVLYESVADMPQKGTDVFKWRAAEFNRESVPAARYIRIVPAGELWLGEVALYDAEGRLLPAEAITVSGADKALFDEQERIPETSTFRNSSYFDEIYHPRTALEHIEKIYPYEISHPPLGKVIMSLGIRMFGMVPFGWRFSGTLFGVLMLPAIYVFLKKMFGGTLVPAAGTAVMASDFMHFVQTRLATIDVYVVFFTILMYLFFWLYWRSDRTDRRSWLPPLALSGLCFGLGAASKWTGIYAGAGLAVLWLLDRIFRARAAENFRGVVREAAENIAWCLLLFVAVPAVIYYVSYWAYGTARGLSGLRMLFSREYLDIVLENQKFMFSYHSGVNATHPYSSVWWQWMLDIRPILYYLEYLDDGTHSSFGAWVNPVLCWGGLLAMINMVYLIIAKRDKTALFILVGYLAQLLPWVFVSRVVFEYHYFPSTIFLLLALCHVLRRIELQHPQPRGVVLSIPIVSVVLFAVFYPALTGVPVSSAYGSHFLKWLPTWPF